MIVQFVVGTFLAVLKWWLERKAKLKPVEIDAMFRHLLIRGVEPFGGVTSPCAGLRQVLPDRDRGSDGW